MSLYPDAATQPPWLTDGVHAPTDEEFEHWLAATSPENRHAVVSRIRQQAKEGHRCFERDHDGTIDRLNLQLEQARARIAFLEKNYQVRRE